MEERIRMLERSMAFGKFFPEGLSFNRHVQEASKLSKPGSVASKKAYFEAYFRKKAAEKMMLETQDGNWNYLSAEIISTMESNGILTERLDENDVNFQVVDYVDRRETQCDSVIRQLDENAVNNQVVSYADRNDDKFNSVTEHLDENAINYQIVYYGDISEYQCNNDTRQLHVNAVNYQVVEYADGSEYQRDHATRRQDENADNYRVVDYADTSEHQCDNVTRQLHENAANHQVVNYANRSEYQCDNATGELDENAINPQIVDCVDKSDYKFNNVTKQQDEGAINYQVVDHTNRSQYQCDNEQSEADISKVAKAENVPQPHVDANLNVENSVQVDNSNQLEDVEVHEKNAIPRYKWMPDPGTAGQEISTLPVKGRKVHTSTKFSIRTRAAKPLHSLPQRNATDKALRSKNSTGGSIGKRRLTARSLHMSINSGETSKTASVGENRTKNSDPNLPKIAEDRRVASQTSTTVSHASFHQASENPNSEGRRTQRVLNKSVSEGMTANAKVSSLSVESLKHPSITRINPRPPTASSPFRFRSEERAAKRKERMNELQPKEAENKKVQLQRRLKGTTEHVCKKLHQNSASKPKLKEDSIGALTSPINQTRKGKTEHVCKKLHQNSASKPKLKEDSVGALTSPINQTRKIPPRGRKQNSIAVKASQNSGKPSISTNDFRQEKTRQSFIPLAKTPRENTSPNIQR